MMVRYYVIALLVSAGGFLIGSVILPRGGELALVYYKSGRYDTARKVLEAELKRGVLTPSNVHFGVNTYRRLGELDRAAALVQRYLALKPDDVEARNALGKLYLEAGKPTLSMMTLEEAERRSPSAQRRVVLLHLYRENGWFKKWEALLRQVVHDGDGGPKDYIDLAVLDARKGRKKSAIRLLTALQTRAPKSFDLKALQLVVSLYLDTDQTTKARETVARWLTAQDGMTQQRVSWLLYFADLFVERGHSSLALQLLEGEAAQAWRNTELLQVLTNLELDNGLAARAFTRLVRYRTANKLKPEQYDLLVRAALATQRWDDAKKYAAIIGTRYLSGNLLLSLSVEALSRRDKAFAVLLGKRVNDAMRQANPVSAAAFSLAADERPDAARWSAVADRIPGLSLDQQMALVNVHVGLNQSDRARQVLRRIASADDVAPQLLIHLASLFAKYGLVTEGRLMMKRIAVRRATLWSKAALLVLSPEPTDTKERVAYLNLKWAAFAGNTVGTAKLLNQIAEASITARRYALAAAAASRLQTVAKSRKNTLLLARALAYSGNAAEAVKILKPLARTDPAAKIAYAEVIVAAVRTGSMPAATAQGFIAQFLTDASVPFGRRQTTVYDLVALKSAAVVLPVLRRLARNRDPRYRILYLEALLQAKEKRTFAIALRNAIRTERSTATLRRLGKWAFQESLQTLAAQAYGRILKAVPNDPAALRHLGLIAFYSNQKLTARRYLTRYLATGADDYVAEYTLGEVINSFPDWRKATPYFRKALAKVSKLRSPTYADRKIMAHLLYRNGRFEDAMRAYEALLRQRPTDRKLRNQYVDFLNNIGRYDRARRWQRGS